MSRRSSQVPIYILDSPHYVHTYACTRQQYGIFFIVWIRAIFFCFAYFKLSSQLWECIDDNICVSEDTRQR